MNSNETQKNSNVLHEYSENTKRQQTNTDTNSLVSWDLIKNPLKKRDTEKNNTWNNMDSFKTFSIFAQGRSLTCSDFEDKFYMHYLV